MMLGRTAYGRIARICLHLWILHTRDPQAAGAKKRCWIFVAYVISHLSGCGFQGKSNHLQHMFPDWVSKGAGEAEAKGFPWGAETLLLADWLTG